MAVTNLSTVTRKILLHTGHAHATGVSVVVNGASELKPGMVSTSTGGTASTLDVAKPDAADDLTHGIVLCNEGHDIDTAYGDNINTTVALRGSGSVCWGWMQAASGATKKGHPLVNTGASDDGFVTVYTVTDVPTSYNEAQLQAETDKLDAYALAYVGLLWRDQANDASNDNPCQIFLG